MKKIYLQGLLILTLLTPAAVWGAEDQSPQDALILQKLASPDQTKTAAATDPLPPDLKPANSADEVVMQPPPVDLAKADPPGANGPEPENPDSGFISSENAPLDKKSKKAVRMADEWQNRPVLPTFEEKDGAIVYTFGATEPVLVCKPLTVCVIRLELGEQILDKPHCGDAARWIITPSESNGGRPPHIYIKPLDSGLVTNLAINTDRRTYIISLRSRNDKYTPLIAFRYPENDEKQWDEYMSQQQSKAAEDARNKRFGAGGGVYDASKLSFAYTVTGEARWKPLRVFNDGKKTYIQMPSIMKMYEAPVLLTINDGTESLVNYRLHDDTFIVDQLFDRAVLLSGVGRAQSKITIERDNIQVAAGPGIISQKIQDN